MSDEVSRELPRWKCHKVVQAAKIRLVEELTIGSPLHSRGPGRLHLQGPLPPISVTAEWMERHDPHEGDYFVRYEDGYESRSPAQAFEEGYTPIGE